jgi:hypothetical protein
VVITGAGPGGLRYPTAADGHPLTGRFASELTVTTTTGVVRLAEPARTARPLLLDLASQPGIRPAQHADRS